MGLVNRHRALIKHGGKRWANYFCFVYTSKDYLIRCLDLKILTIHTFENVTMKVVAWCLNGILLSNCLQVMCFM